MVFNVTCVSIVFLSFSRKLKWVSVNYQYLLYSNSTGESVKLMRRKRMFLIERSILDTLNKWE